MYRNRSCYCDVVTPGTGKTLTGVKLVYWYVDMNKQHARSGGSHRQVLYCGPSNSSVDVAASKLHSCLFANVDAELVVKIFQVNTHTHTHTQPFYGPFSRTTRVSWCQKRTSGLYGANEE